MWTFSLLVKGAMRMSMPSLSVLETIWMCSEFWRNSFCPSRRMLTAPSGMENVRAYFMYRSAVPLLDGVFVQGIEIFMVSVYKQDGKRQRFQFA